MNEADDTHKDILRSQISNIIIYFSQSTNTSSFRFSIIHQQFVSTRKFPADHPYIVVMRSDNVILYKREFEQCLTDMISDSTCYAKCSRDPTNTYQNKFIEIVKVGIGMLDEQTAKSMKAYLHPKFMT